MKIGGDKQRNASGHQGENEQQGKKKRTGTQATKLLVSTHDISYTHVRCVDQFSFLGNRARYGFIELDMSTGLDLSIPSSRPLTFPGGQSKNGYRAR